MTVPLVVLVVAFGIAAASAIMTVRSLAARNARLHRSLDYYRKTFTTLTGWNCKIGNYHFASFDGGVHWYNVKQVPCGDDGKVGLMIDSVANPADVQLAQGMRRLVRYASAHGSIDLSDSQQSALLTQAGFELEDTSH